MSLTCTHLQNHKRASVSGNALHELLSGLGPYHGHKAPQLDGSNHRITGQQDSNWMGAHLCPKGGV
eukprot:9428323-Karenia_brevis.AAC.1